MACAHMRLPLPTATTSAVDLVMAGGGREANQLPSALLRSHHSSSRHSPLSVALHTQPRLLTQLPGPTQRNNTPRGGARGRGSGKGPSGNPSTTRRTHLWMDPERRSAVAACCAWRLPVRNCRYHLGRGGLRSRDERPSRRLRKAAGQEAGEKEPARPERLPTLNCLTDMTSVSVQEACLSRTTHTHTHTHTTSHTYTTRHTTSR
ncbi:hypothetical protein LZ30DRAFT_296797 [Colletotrichum cereale]|nr:hypothetical protein LZ30DRAFT_296797 [Colletotrichum cereale]